MIPESTYGITKKNFTKTSCSVEIYVIVRPSSLLRHMLPIAGTEPLTPALVDNTLLQYVVYGDKVELLKTMDYAVVMEINKQKFTLPFLDDFILKKLSKKEKNKLDQIIETNQDYAFFQLMVS
jgi:hypothetical protein